MGRYDIPGENARILCGGNDTAAFGAIDAKVISSSTIRRDETLFVSGPPRGPGVPVFEWLTSGFADSHSGQPDRWDFGWYVVGGPDEKEVSDPEGEMAAKPEEIFERSI